ncbi:MAG: heme biosynthesis protein HemY [Rhizobiaceae bacterium]|nr:heme biosynthesis protein HemY [Rhizobiaceae bacterium]
MIKGLIFFVIVLAMGIGFAWLADRPGEMLINWQGQQIELSLMTAVSLIVAIIVAVMLTWWIIRVVLTSPEIMSKFLKTRKRDRGYKALSDGLIAAGAGDATMAKKLTKQSRNLLDEDNEPLLNLLEVQTAMIDGRDDDARASLQKMADKPDTAILGLRGLYLEAKRLGAGEAARQYAMKAADQAPHLSWASEAAIEYCAQDANWDDAIRRLEKQRTAGVISNEDAKRKKAVLLAGRALTRSDGELQDIGKDAQAALSLAPDLVPAATIAAKALFRQGNLRKGSRILEKLWKENPHAQIADTYVNARVGDTAGDKLKRAQKLESLKGNQVESLFIVAKMALETRNFELARSKVEAAARLDPRESMYLLLADIEEAETGDQGRVRHWLSCAVKAPRDPQWTADGYVSDKWAPFSPVTGKLDSFEWKTPLTALTGPVAEGDVAENGFEEAKSNLPAIAAMPEVAPVEDAAVEEDVVITADDDKVIEIVPDQTTPEEVVETSEETSLNETEAPKEADTETIAEDVPVTPEAPADATVPEEEPVKEVTSLRVDDPGVDENVDEAEKKGRFSLF